MAGPRMVYLTGADSDFAARVLVAKLGSAGILAEVRGVSGIYPVLDRAAVWVEEEAAADARELITADLEDAFEATPEAGPAAASHRWVRPVLVALSLVLLGSLGLAPRCSPASTVQLR